MARFFYTDILWKYKSPIHGSVEVEHPLLLAFMLAGVGIIHAQATSKAAEQGAPSPARIAEWEDDVSEAILFLHQVFPDIKPKSKSIVQNNLDWRMSPGGLGSFRVDVCEPDVPNRNRNEEESRDFFTHPDIQCSVLTIQADFLMTSSQLGPVPAHIFIWRPDIEKRRSELAALLVAHPNWSEEQVEEAMKASGVKYGKSAHNDVAGLVHDAWPKLEIFFGEIETRLNGVLSTAPNGTHATGRSVMDYQGTSLQAGPNQAAEFLYVRV